MESSLQLVLWFIILVVSHKAVDLTLLSSQTRYASGAALAPPPAATPLPPRPLLLYCHSGLCCDCYNHESPVLLLNFWLRLHALCLQRRVAACRCAWTCTWQLRLTSSGCISGSEALPAGRMLLYFTRASRSGAAVVFALLS